MDLPDPVCPTRKTNSPRRTEKVALRRPGVRDVVRLRDAAQLDRVRRIARGRGRGCARRAAGRGAARCAACMSRRRSSSSVAAMALARLATEGCFSCRLHGIVRGRERQRAAVSVTAIWPFALKQRELRRPPARSARRTRAPRSTRAPARRRPRARCRRSRSAASGPIRSVRAVHLVGPGERVAPAGAGDACPSSANVGGERRARRSPRGSRRRRARTRPPRRRRRPACARGSAAAASPRAVVQDERVRARVVNERTCSERRRDAIGDRCAAPTHALLRRRERPEAQGRAVDLVRRR